ncbi:MAG: hypothetical protein PUB09_03155 [Firmicutes bacterium]|nr:hypothetical protein [Bacillota bacterium]
MKKISKQIILSLIFLAILAVCLFYAQQQLIPFNDQDTNQTATFYETEEDSVDVLTVGASSVMVSFSPLRLYENTGITSYVRCSSVQAPPVTYLNVKESLKTQKPKLVVVSAYTLLLEYDYDEYESWLRRGMDYKKLSIDKIKIAKAISDRSEWQTTSSFIFPILRYHARWKNILNGENHKEHLGEYDYMHGQFPVYKHKTIEDVSAEKMAETELAPITDDNMYWYDKMITLCKENDIQVLLLVTPDMRWTTGKHEALQQIADKYDVQFLDFNVDDITAKCGIDWETDFYDNHHVNAPASIKVTDYLSDYIVDTYGFGPSDVSDSVKNQFEEDIVQFKKDLKEKKCQ